MTQRDPSMPLSFIILLSHIHLPNSRVKSQQLEMLKLTKES